MKQNAKTNKTKNMSHIESNMSHIKKQGGITLIALVVTIVVLLILAGVSVNAIIGDEGIVNKAKEAQTKMNEAQQNDKNSLSSLSNWLDETLNEIGDNTTGGSLPTTTDTAPYLPNETFMQVSGTNLNNGLVIKDTVGNEYVWIEVPKSLYNNEAYNKETTAEDKKPATSTDYDKIEYCLHKYTEEYRKDENENLTSNADIYYSDEVTGLTSAQYTELKQKMLKSVYENGGFWIGKYEAGITTNRTMDSETPTVAPLSKAGTVENPIYPYTCIKCSEAQTLATNLSSGESYTSSLMFGVQWDLVLKHIEVKEVEKGTSLATIQNAIKVDSKDWGNYRDASFTLNRGKYAECVEWSLSTTWNPYNQTTTNGFVNSSSVKQAQSNGNGILLTTGASDECSKMNIYDLAGNVNEWTLEYDASGTGPFVSRGGSYLSSSFPIFYRSHGDKNDTDFINVPIFAEYIGFRVALYK